jgi:hypothetical protein
MDILNVLKELNTIMPPAPKTVDPDIKANNRLKGLIQQNKTCEYCGRNDRPLEYAHLNDATGEYFDPAGKARSEKGQAFRHLTHVSDLDNRAHVCGQECHKKIHTAAKEGKPLTVAELKHAQLEHRNDLKSYYDKYLYRRFKPVMGLIDKLLVEEKAKPQPNMRKIKSLIRDRRKHNRTLREIKAGLQGTRYITRTGKVAMMIKSFLMKYDNALDPNEPRQTRYLHNLPSMDTNIKYEDPFDPEMYGEEEPDDDYTPEMHTQNTSFPRETTKYNKIINRISPQGSQEVLDKIVGEEEIPYAKSLVKSIDGFISKRAAYAPINHRRYFNEATKKYYKTPQASENAVGTDYDTQLDIDTHQGDIDRGEAPTSNYLSRNIGSRNRMSQKLIDPEQTRYRGTMQPVMNMQKLSKSINSFVRKFETKNLPQEGTGKYKPQNEARARLNNKLKPHEMSNRKQEVNPASPPPMGFGQKTNPADHVVDNYVPVDKTHTFKYRGRTYDAGKMTPEEIADILAEMEQQIQ